jgi:hypothetical protein
LPYTRRRLILAEQTAHQPAGGELKQLQGRGSNSSNGCRAQLLVGRQMTIRVQQQCKKEMWWRGMVAEQQAEEGEGGQGWRMRVRQR